MSNAIQETSPGILGKIERVCDKLPPPGVIFFILFVATAVLSALLSGLGVSLINPASGETVSVQNFFTADGINWFLETMVENFSSFYPLGMVLILTMAVGLCDEAGLFSAAIRSALRNTPQVIVPLVVAFVGCNGNIASDCCNIVLMPLAAAVYYSVGKHPVVGMLVAYAGCEAGFACNLMLSASDSIASGLTNTAIQSFLPDSDFLVDMSCNYYFTFTSTFLVALTISFVAEKIVAKQFGPYHRPADLPVIEKQELGDIERKGIRNAVIALVVYVALVVAGYFLVPLAKVNEDGSLSFIGSPLLDGIIAVMFVAFFVMGVAYGFTVKKFRSLTDIEKAINKQMSLMGAYLTFCFFCGQFNALFSWTNIGTVIAIGGADFIQNIGLTGIPLILIFIVIVALTNFFMPSASAKWAILGPVFVPMLMMLDYHPAMIQLIYRLADSPFNIITPMNPYVWMLLSIANRDYDPNLKIGKVFAGLIPISLILAVVWIIFFFIWTTLGIPLGPGASYTLPAGLL